MGGVIYLTLIPVLNYFFGNKENSRSLLMLCLLFILDIVLVKVLSLKEHDLLFFSSRALFDAFLIVVVSKFDVSLFRKRIMYFACLLSLSINIYLCFEKGNVFLYRHWEIVNSVLCELMVFTLITSEIRIMFSGFKKYLYGAVAAVILFLAGMLKYRTHQKEQLKEELQVEKYNAAVKDNVVKKEKAISKGLEQTRKESDVIHEQNKKDAVSRTRPSGNFNDSRL